MSDEGLRITHRSRHATQPETLGFSTMAGQAKGADVIKAAFASALTYCNNVIGIPQGGPFAGDSQLSDLAAPGRTIASCQDIKAAAQTLGVQSAKRATPAIPLKDLLAQIGGIGAKTPFMDA